VQNVKPKQENTMAKTEAVTKKKVVTIKLDHVLEPPIYKDCVTTGEPTPKAVGVASIEHHPVGFVIKSKEGIQITIPMSSVKHFIEE